MQQGQLDLNQRMQQSKCCALPLGDGPSLKKANAYGCVGFFFGWVMGLEPTTFRATI